MNFTFGTKAETLERLGPLVQAARWPDQLYFSVAEWRGSQADLLDAMLERFGSTRIIVRSSARNEDGPGASMAGAYLSVLDVEPDRRSLRRAVEDVISSYDSDAADHQILVQPHIEGIVIAGVVLTRELDAGGPYYVINYDDTSGRSDTVTSGEAENKTILVHRSKPHALHSSRFRELVSAIKEIETATDHQELDVEFCIDRQHDIYILQVRVISAARRWEAVPDDVVDRAIDDVRGEVGRRLLPEPGLHGSASVLGDMPDWNPAEMIGKTPKPLSTSLYRYLITDRAWLESRRRMGYRHFHERPLLVELAGCPYIDVRRSLNSFLPDSLPDDVGARLVECQLSLIREHPGRHDKIEFEVATTCLDLSFEQRATEMYGDVLSAEGLDILKGALRRLTNELVQGGSERIAGLLSRTRKLRREVGDRGQETLRERVRSLLDACFQFGTLPFAQLARDGFIGMSLLRSMVERGVLSPGDKSKFMQGIDSVANRVARAMYDVSQGARSLSSFLADYGHLRPGTYDILSYRYDERPDLYLGTGDIAPLVGGEPFELSSAQEASLAGLLEEVGLRSEPAAVLEYIRHAIAAREEAKFEFTRCVSEVLSLLAGAGRPEGLSREDLAFLRIEEYLDADDAGRCAECVARNRELHQITRTIRLPHLITEVADVDVIRLPLGQPTYITGQSVTAPAQLLGEGDKPELSGRIVLIEGADPGYDWIFSHGISGLVTKYGGVNSHMAIRCAEFGLPAAIGCGERLFEIVARGRLLRLDCGARSIEVLR